MPVAVFLDSNWVGVYVWGWVGGGLHVQCFISLVLHNVVLFVPSLFLFVCYSCIHGPIHYTAKQAGGASHGGRNVQE